MTGGSASGKQRGKFGIFSFFTGAGFLDLGFEDAGGGVESMFFSRRDRRDRRDRRGGETA